MRIKTNLYKLLRISNDINAILKGRILKRIYNKIVGRTMGKLMR